MKKFIVSASPLPIILNRDFKLDDGEWIHLARHGQIRAPMEGSGKEVEVVQVLDDATFDAVVTFFRDQATEPNFPGVLVDFEHFSYDKEKESRAAAWITDLEKRKEGLFAKARYSSTGRAAIEGGDYRLISPVFAFEPRTYRAGEKVRPKALDSAGLTNDPRIKGMIPISNRNGNSADAAENQKNVMKTLLKKLGLAEDASEESAVAALQVIQNRATTAEGSVGTLTKERDELAAAQVEADLDKHADVIANRDEMKKLLIANRSVALSVLAGLKKADKKTPATITNRGTAKTPEKKEGAEESTEPSLDAKRTAAVSAYRTANRGSSFQEAWDAVRAEKPELFSEPAAQE